MGCVTDRTRKSRVDVESMLVEAGVGNDGGEVVTLGTE
jgi:hypothetical protein